MTAAIPKVDKKVFVFLLSWALMGLPKCLEHQNAVRIVFFSERSMRRFP